MKSTRNAEVRPAVQRDIRTYDSLQPLNAMITLCQESQRSLADLLATPSAVPAELLRERGGSEEPVALPEPLAGDLPFDQVLIARTSIRFYDRRPLHLGHLATLLHVASAGDEQDWPQEVEVGNRLHFYAVAWRITDLPPAVYWYDPEAHALRYTGPAPDQEREGANLVIQTEFARAPLIIVITGNLAVACARHGSAGHSQLLQRAGSAGHRCWLASLGIGLVGTVFAGFVPRAAQRIAGIDGYTNAGLFAYAAGHLHPAYALAAPIEA
jgi:hypothetical protein